MMDYGGGGGFSCKIQHISFILLLKLIPSVSFMQPSNLNILAVVPWGLARQRISLALHHRLWVVVVVIDVFFLAQPCSQPQAELVPLTRSFLAVSPMCVFGEKQ